MGNKKKGPGDKFRAWLTGQDNLGPMGKKWAGIGLGGLTAIGTAMGIQTRANKKKEFMNKNYPGQNYDKNLVPKKNKATGITMGDEFKSYRKGMSEMKTGGSWTRTSKLTKNGKQKNK